MKSLACGFMQSGWVRGLEIGSPDLLHSSSPLPLWRTIHSNSLHASPWKWVYRKSLDYEAVIHIGVEGLSSLSDLTRVTTQWKCGLDFGSFPLYFLYKIYTKFGSVGFILDLVQ